MESRTEREREREKGRIDRCSSIYIKYSSSHHHHHHRPTQLDPRSLRDHAAPCNAGRPPSGGCSQSAYWCSASQLRSTSLFCLSTMCGVVLSKKEKYFSILLLPFFYFHLIENILLNKTRRNRRKIQWENLARKDQRSKCVRVDEYFMRLDEQRKNKS